MKIEVLDKLPENLASQCVQIWYIEDRRNPEVARTDVSFQPNRACAERYVKSLLRSNNGDNFFAHSPEDFALRCEYLRLRDGWTFCSVPPDVIEFKDFV